MRKNLQAQWINIHRTNKYKYVCNARERKKCLTKSERARSTRRTTSKSKSKKCLNYLRINSPQRKAFVHVYAIHKLNTSSIESFSSIVLNTQQRMYPFQQMKICFNKQKKRKQSKAKIILNMYYIHQFMSETSKFEFYVSFIRRPKRKPTST